MPFAVEEYTTNCTLTQGQPHHIIMVNMLRPIPPNTYTVKCAPLVAISLPRLRKLRHPAFHAVVAIHSQRNWKLGDANDSRVEK
eukprot:COSAG01_NODE_2878_length_6926_cov_5.737073_6_plen_84_part_00